VEKKEKKKGEEKKRRTCRHQLLLFDQPLVNCCSTSSATGGREGEDRGAGRKEGKKKKRGKERSLPSTDLVALGLWPYMKLAICPALERVEGKGKKGGTKSEGGREREKKEEKRKPVSTKFIPFVMSVFEELEFLGLPWPNGMVVGRGQTSGGVHRKS